MPRLAEFVFGPGSETPTTDRAFIVWSRTDLNKYRLTSAIEFYDADGRLVTWFALILPEYSTTRFRAAGCGNWEQPVDEPSAFGSGERHVLRTSKGICDGRRCRNASNSCRSAAGTSNAARTRPKSAP